MWKIAICDDEPYVQDDIRNCLRLCALEREYEVDCFGNGEALLAAFENNAYDLIYLNIELPEKSGIEIAKLLRKRQCNAAIIFLTNYDEYLETGYEVEAFRYRLKPINEELFQKDFNAWKLWYEEHKLHSVVITTAQGNYQVAVDDILYLEIVHRKVHITTKNTTYITLESMHYWEQLLTGFTSPYNKILVNKKHVKFFDDTKVIVTGEYQLPVSRRKYQQFCADMMK